MEFIDILQKLVKDKGITKSRVLADLGLSKNSFIDWAKHKNVPNGETLQKLAQYFGVTIEDLLGEKRKEEQHDPIFFRLKKGLETYEIDNEDIDFLLTVMKAHKERNKK